MIEHCLTINYLYKNRWISYWYQLKEIASLDDIVSVLEIGPGNRVVSDTLIKMGYRVKTLDIDNNSGADYIADLRADPRTYLGSSFDAILCCQVLEHLPYDDFCKSLRNICSASRRYAVFSLPYTNSGVLKIRFRVKFFRPFIKFFDIMPIKNVFNGQHYWEIGKRGYPLKKVLDDISKAGFMILKHYPIYENPYHYMIVCGKQQEGVRK